MRPRPLAVVLVASVVLAGVAFERGQVRIPAHLNPFAPLDLVAEPNWLTRFKLSRLDRDPARCSAILATSDMVYTVLGNRETGPRCGFNNAVSVHRTPTAVGEEFALSCRAAVSLLLWERHVVQPAARLHFGQEVTRFEHFGSYACRNVYGRPEATRSRHATAEAWDVAGFRLADGTRIRVASDWQQGAAALFLHEVRTGACRFFDGVLSPDYNAAHEDHLHLDRGPYRICR